MDFINLHRQYDLIKEKINGDFQNIFSHKRFIGGDEIKALEERLADYTGRKYALCCASGTDALVLPLKAYGLKKNDAVFVPSFTFFASAESVSLAGGTPVFVDSKPDTFNIDPSSLEKTIENVISDGELTPRGIIPVDLFGQPAEHEEIKKIADKYGMFILEDGAQGFGGEISGKRACSFGDVSATSFFPAKPLGCYGDGGCVFTDDADMYSELKSLHVHGQGSDKYDNVAIGLNSRLDTLQAAVLIAKLDIFEEEVKKRNMIADKYSERLAGSFVTPYVVDGYISSWAQYTLIADSEEERERLRNALSEKDIPTMVYYPTPIHKSTAYKSEKIYADSLKNAEKLSKTVFSLPMHPYLTDEEIDLICDELLKLK